MNKENELSCTTDGAVACATPATRPAPVYRPYHTSRYDDEAWEVAVRLPGAKKEEVSVTVEDEILEVVAKRRLETPETWRPIGHREEERQWHLRLDVGPEVDGSRITGSLEDGVLTLRLPLREEVKPRRIEIQ